jgi:hypothetical protein
MSLRNLIAALVFVGFVISFSRAADDPLDDEPGKDVAKKEAKAGPVKSALGKAKSDSAQDKAFRAAQRGALSQMKNKNEDKRAEAFDKLKDFPTIECAKLLVQQGMASPYDDVRKQAYATLTSFRDSDEVCKYLLATVEKDTTRGTATETTCALFAVPLSSDSPEVEKKAFDLFEKTASHRKGGLLLLVSMADRLGAEGDAASVNTLVKISKRPIFNEQFGIRRSVVQALSKIEEKEAVDALLTILSSVQGEVRGDIVQHLTAISGQKFGLDPAAWDTWWKANKEKFEFPPAGARAVNKAEAVGARSMYYGLPIYATRLVFVIDTSGSMHQATERGTRIELAKRELINAISGLPEGVYFDVVAFDRVVSPWQRQLAIASSENKKKASMWVLSRGLGGGTASYDALEAALDFDTEAVYFLTDGAPHGGKVVNPIEIVEVISRLNFTRRVTIHAIGIGVGPALPTNPFHFFLSTLAERNYGEYRAVNE